MNFFERSVQAKEQMVRLFKARQPVEEFDFSCKSVAKALDAMKPVIESLLRLAQHICYIVIHKKPSVIAVFLLAESFERIQVTSSVPGEYNIEDYSAGTHEITSLLVPAK